MKIDSIEEHYVGDVDKQILITPQMNAKTNVNAPTVEKTTPHTPEHAKNGRKKKKS